MIKRATTTRHQRADDIDVTITPEIEREASEELAQRIAVTLVDPLALDEEARAPGDRSPGMQTRSCPEEPRLLSGRPS